MLENRIERLNNLRIRCYEEGKTFDTYINDLDADTVTKSQHIIHSARIEGNTFTEGDTITFLVTGEVNINSRYSVEERHEIKDLYNAFTYMLEEARETRYLSIDTLLYLHSICMMNDPDALPGEFKMSDNQTIYRGQVKMYAPADDVEELLSEAINTYNLSDMNIVDIADVSLKFINIHPFKDGNGRIHRLLINYLLISNGYVPIIIHEDDVNEYISMCHNYDLNNDPTDFAEFLVEKLFDVYTTLI